MKDIDDEIQDLVEHLSMEAERIKFEEEYNDPGKAEQVSTILQGAAMGLEELQ